MSSMHCRILLSELGSVCSFALLRGVVLSRVDDYSSIEVPNRNILPAVVDASSRVRSRDVPKPRGYQQLHSVPEDLLLLEQHYHSHSMPSWIVLPTRHSVGNAVPVSQRHLQQQLELGIGVWVCVVHAGYVLRVSWSDSAYGSLQGESCSM